MSKQTYATIDTEQLKQQFQAYQEPNELELLTSQLMKAGERNRSLQEELARIKGENTHSKGGIEKLTAYIREQEKKLSDLQQMNYASKKSLVQKLEIEKKLDQQTAEISTLQDELRALQNALNDGKQQGEQLERVIQFLRERSEEFNLEAKQLKEDYQVALETIVLLREQQTKLEAAIEAGKQTIQQANEEKNETVEELEMVHKQLENLKIALADLQKTSENHVALLEENQNLKSKLEYQSSAWDQTQHEIQIIRQTLLRTLKDSKKLEVQYEEVLNERISLANRTAQLQNMLDLQIDQTRIAQEQLLEAQQKETRSKMEHERAAEELKLQIAELENSLQTASMQQEEGIVNLSTQYEKGIATLENELAQIKQELLESRSDYTEASQSREELKLEIQHLSYQLNTTQSDISEKDNDLRISQQHLAKKVKEVTYLQDKLESQQMRIEEQSRLLAAAEQKGIDLEKMLYDERERSVKFQQQMSEGVKTAEEKAARLEEKHFDLHQRWAATEARNRELEKLAERHNQLQMQMQQFFGGFSAAPQMTAPHTIAEPAAISFADPMPETTEPEKSKPFHNLFQPTKGNGRIKSNLFD